MMAGALVIIGVVDARIDETRVRGTVVASRRDIMMAVMLLTGCV